MLVLVHKGSERNLWATWMEQTFSHCNFLVVNSTAVAFIRKSMHPTILNSMSILNQVSITRHCFVKLSRDRKLYEG